MYHKLVIFGSNSLKKSVLFDMNLAKNITII